MKISLVELLLGLTTVSIVLLCVFIFKLAIAGKLTWGHVFWLNVLFG